MVTAGRVVGETEDGSGTDEFPDPVDVLRPSSDVAVYAPALTREFQTLGGEAIDEAAARLTALYVDAMGQLVQEAATYRDGRSSRKTTDIQKWGRRFYQARVAKPPQFRVGFKSPAELTSHERIRQTEVLDWHLAVDENDPLAIAHAASKMTTLAALVIQAINLGGDETGIPDDDLAEEVLVEIARFNAAACHRLARLLAGRA